MELRQFIPQLMKPDSAFQPRGLLLERENKTTLVNANSSTAYWVYNSTQKQLDAVCNVCERQ